MILCIVDGLVRNAVESDIGRQEDILGLSLGNGNQIAIVIESVFGLIQSIDRDTVLKVIDALACQSSRLPRLLRRILVRAVAYVIGGQNPDAIVHELRSRCCSAGRNFTQSIDWQRVGWKRNRIRRIGKSTQGQLASQLVTHIKVPHEITNGQKVSVGWITGRRIGKESDIRESA